MKILFKKKYKNKGITSVEIVMMFTISGLFIFSWFLADQGNKPFTDFLENGISNILSHSNKGDFSKIKTDSLPHYKEFGKIENNTLYYEDKIVSIKSSPVSPNSLPDSSLKLEVSGKKSFVCKVAIKKMPNVKKFKTYLNGKDFNVDKMSYKECINIPATTNDFQLTQYFY